MYLLKTVVLCFAIVAICGCESSQPTPVELSESADSIGMESKSIRAGSLTMGAGDKPGEVTETKSVMTQPLYKIVSRTEWQQVLAAQALAGFGIDLTDGFIHLSSGDQVEEIVQRYFSGRDDLMLISIDGSSLGEILRWEESLDGALFPHVYGTIPMAAVLDAEPLRLGTDGNHQFPF